MKVGIIDFIKRNYITVALSTLMALILVGAAFTIYNRKVMVENTFLQKQTEWTKENLGNIFDSDLRRMDLGLRGYAITQNEQVLNPYKDGMNEIKWTIHNIDSAFQVQKLDTLAEAFNRFKVNLDEYIGVTKQLKEYADQGDLESFKGLLAEDRGFDLWEAWSPIFFAASDHQNMLIEQARNNYQRALNRNITIQIVLILFSIPTIASVIYRLRKDSKMRSNLLEEFSKHNKRYVYNSGDDEDEKNQESIIANSVENLKKASAFIKEITKGNYAITWSGLTEKNADLNQGNLVGDLVKMRDQMKEVKAESDQRLWSTDGLAQFSDVARNNQSNNEQLTNEVVKFLANYLDAQQGSLFVLQDEDSEDLHLKLMACYAFDKKKYVERRIDIGSGLVGQAYLEGGTVMLTELPQGYINITSGLGDATPECVIIVPMKYNEQVEAVLELARFEDFETHEIEFLEKAGEVLASAIYSTKINEKTSLLLEQSREQAEILRAQEEELRQNMEEMQATQEDMRRREDELRRATEAHNNS